MKCKNIINKEDKICFDENCYNCYQKSFMNTKLKNIWASNNIKNPREVYYKSRENIKLICNNINCQHEYIGPAIYLKRNHKCPYCSKQNKLLCDKEKKCNICFENSLEYTEYSKYLSDNNFKYEKCKKHNNCMKCVKKTNCKKNDFDYVCNKCINCNQCKKIILSSYNIYKNDNTYYEFICNICNINTLNLRISKIKNINQIICKNCKTL